MEEGFKERVQKLFGSHLFQEVPKSSFPAASWSVSDSQVERRQWNRQPGGGDPDRDERPCAAAFDDKEGCLGRIRRDNRRFEGYLDDLDELDEEEKGEAEDEFGDTSGEGDEEREILESIGLDSTLDHEEEEDEYDRVAVQKEWTDGRLYMRDVTDHGPYINYQTVMTDLLNDEPEGPDSFSKDPRADHAAASFRLQEDSQEGGTLDHDSSCNYLRPAANCAVMVETGIATPKSILKRKRDGDDSRPRKHVHFDPAFVDPRNEKLEEDSAISATTAMAVTGTGPPAEDVNPSSESGTSLEDYSPGTELKTFEEGSPGVPDYVRNPSKYTKYTFETSDEVNESSNQKAFADFRKLIGCSESTEADAETCRDLPKSIVFTPRKKAIDAMVTDTENKPGKGEDSDRQEVRSISIAAGEDQDNEFSAMDCDDMQQQPAAGDKQDPPQKAMRKYRAKAAVDDSDNS